MKLKKAITLICAHLVFMSTVCALAVNGLAARPDVNASLPSYAAADKTDQEGETKMTKKQKIVFATYAGDQDDLYWGMVMAESIRSFAGNLRNVPIWVYLPEGNPELEKIASEKQASLALTLKKSTRPDAAKGFWFSGKVYAAAKAETEAQTSCEILAWLDPDIVFVKEPQAFILDDTVSIGCRPVMHKLIGSTFSEPPDEFWSRVYAKLSVPESSIFPVTTPVDRITIRGYFNAGMLIVRPERGILRKWPKAFESLYTDSTFVAWCKQDRLRAIFLHQAALAGVILSTVRQQEIVQLTPVYNYPLNLADDYPPEAKPASLDHLIMFRHDLMFSDTAAQRKVSDDSKIFRWLKERFPQK